MFYFDELSDNKRQAKNDNHEYSSITSKQIDLNSVFERLGANKISSENAIENVFEIFFIVRIFSIHSANSFNCDEMQAKFPLRMQRNISIKSINWGKKTLQEFSSESKALEIYKIFFHF